MAIASSHERYMDHGLRWIEHLHVFNSLRKAFKGVNLKSFAAIEADALPDPTADVVRWNDADVKQAFHQGISLEFRLEYK